MDVENNDLGLEELANEITIRSPYWCGNFALGLNFFYEIESLKNIFSNN